MKQSQKSLLSFFSPSSATSNKATPKNSDSSKKTLKCRDTKSTKSSRKRIDFRQVAENRQFIEPVSSIDSISQRNERTKVIDSSSDTESDLIPPLKKVCRENNANKKDSKKICKEKVNRKADTLDTNRRIGRKRLVVPDDDSCSEDDFCLPMPKEASESEYSEHAKCESSIDTDTEGTGMDEMDDLGPAQADKKLEPSPVLKKTVGKKRKVSAAKETIVEIKTADTNSDTTSVRVCGSGRHLHDTLPWLHEERRDKNGNRPDSDAYDPRKLYVPPGYLKKETPAMIQWWQVKSDNMDTVLFFKVGKFYELFHMDADVGFKELNLIYMKGEKAHSGFPEIAYEKMASQLVQKGYRVARVEQTETPEMMKKRNINEKQKSKVVRREICSFVSPGTITAGFMDASSLQDDSCTNLLVLKESQSAYESKVTPKFGVCIVDCSTANFQIGEFTDTLQRDRLKTLFAQYRIAEIIFERNGLSKETKQIMRFGAPNAVYNELIAVKEFWTATKTVEELQAASYFDKSEWPDAIESFLTNEKQVKHSHGDLALSSLGGCIWYLRHCLVDKDLLSLRRFTRYIPSDQEACALSDENLTRPRDMKQHYVVIDSQTLRNLEILVNNRNGKKEGSLIDILDRTVSPFGRRMYQEWIMKPLCQVDDINNRLDAVDELCQTIDVLESIRSQLRTIPDLERLLSRVHALGSMHRAKDHPDSRAVMYETNTYNTRKVKDFLAVLEGFETGLQLLMDLASRSNPLCSSALKSIVQDNKDAENKSKEKRSFAAVKEMLHNLKHGFDHTSAQDSGIIIPLPGLDPDYDKACADIREIEQLFEEQLQKYKSLFQCKQISYWGKKKEDRYQLEVPESAISKQPSEFELKSGKKGYKRFHTPRIRELLTELSNAEDRRAEALHDQMRRIFYKFDEQYPTWLRIMRRLATLDCYQSLATVSANSEGYTRPIVTSAVAENDGIPFIEIEQGMHASIANSENFIPNDTSLGSQGKGHMMLLSGPNMGGKSTLLRQTCLITLMAQIGCFVPAAKCKLTPVDRIFTRIGATDHLLAGQSTLYVELYETATILNHATQHSLVILDELGRGTSTFDGTAIAYAVAEDLLRRVRCRAMFATHYHSLVEEYSQERNVQLGHMACMVDPTQDHKVTYLYKLREGMCPKSYGMNVAMLAQLPEEVIDCAARKSKQLEESLQENLRINTSAVQLYNEIESGLQNDSLDETQLRNLWQQAKQLTIA